MAGRLPDGGLRVIGAPGWNRALHPRLHFTGSWTFTSVDFEHLYRTTQPKVRAYARSLAASEADADDAVAEAYLTAWRRQRDIPRDAELGWLLGVTRRVLANARRSERRVGALRTLLGVGPASGSAPTRVERIADQTLRAALMDLAPLDREAVVLTASFDLSSADAARALGITPAAYRMRVARAPATPAHRPFRPCGESPMAYLVNEELDRRLQATRPALAGARRSAAGAPARRAATQRPAPRAGDRPGRRAGRGGCGRLRPVRRRGGNASAIEQAMHWFDPPAGAILHTHLTDTNAGKTTDQEFWGVADDITALARIRYGGAYEVSSDGIYDVAGEHDLRADHRRQAGQRRHRRRGHQEAGPDAGRRQAAAEGGVRPGEGRRHSAGRGGPDRGQDPHAARARARRGPGSRGLRRARRVGDRAQARYRWPGLEALRERRRRQAARPPRPRWRPGRARGRQVVNLRDQHRPTRR